MSWLRSWFWFFMPILARPLWSWDILLWRIQVVELLSQVQRIVSVIRCWRGQNWDERVRVIQARHALLLVSLTVLGGNHFKCLLEVWLLSLDFVIVILFLIVDFMVKVMLLLVHFFYFILHFNDGVDVFLGSWFLSLDWVLEELHPWLPWLLSALKFLILIVLLNHGFPLVLGLFDLSDFVLFNLDMLQAFSIATKVYRWIIRATLWITSRMFSTYTSCANVGSVGSVYLTCLGSIQNQEACSLPRKECLQCLIFEVYLTLIFSTLTMKPIDAILLLLEQIS